MKILDINISLGMFIVALIGLAVGILTWWITKLLKDKETMTIHELKIKNLEEGFADLKQRIKDLEKNI